MKILSESKLFSPSHPEINGIDENDIEIYIHNVAQWLTGLNSKSIQENIIKLYSNNNQIRELIQNYFKNRFGTEMTCYRGLHFMYDDNSWTECFGHNPHQGQIYNFVSTSARLLSSWSTSKGFVGDWVSRPQRTYFIFEATIPYDMVVYFNDMWTKEDALNMFTRDNHLSNVYNFASYIDSFEFQHEVTVWHKKPLQAKLISWSKS